ncbi:hypothetical protein [Amycolatopsis sp. WGS_07]|uniref:hypothetical protein n=1 Tax=Amycolatopsis sp. WGS_07 TaxID=3076764 RepID=UPI0038734B0D
MLSSTAPSRWRAQCVALLQDGDWHQLYKTAMSWRNDGGAYLPEAWLMDVCSALLHRQPKTAVHSCDLALQMWVERPQDRAVLHFVRGLLIADHLGDPKTAVAGLELAASGPNWLGGEDLARVRQTTSRVRVPRAQPAPAYDQAYVDLISSSASSPRPPVPEPLPADGTQPGLWSEALQHLRKA